MFSFARTPKAKRKNQTGKFLEDDSAQVGIGLIAAEILMPVSKWLASIFAERVANSGLGEAERRAKQMISRPEPAKYRIWYRQNVLDYLNKCAESARHPIYVVYYGLLVKKGTPVYYCGNGEYREGTCDYHSIVISSDHDSSFKEDTVLVLGSIVLKNQASADNSAEKNYRSMAVSYLAAKLGGLKFGDVEDQYYSSLENIGKIFSMYEPGFFVGTGLILPDGYLGKYGIDQDNINKDQKWMDYVRDTLLVDDLYMGDCLTALQRQIGRLLPSYMDAYKSSSERDSAAAFTPYTEQILGFDRDWLKATYLKTVREYLKRVKYSNESTCPVHTVFVGGNIYAYKIEIEKNKRKITCITEKQKEQGGDPRIRTANRINYDILNLFWLRNEFARKMLLRCANRILESRKESTLARIRSELKVPGISTIALDLKISKIKGIIAAMDGDAEFKSCRTIVELVQEINTGTTRIKKEYYAKHPRVM